jgi:hypothetical protein
MFYRKGCLCPILWIPAIIEYRSGGRRVSVDRFFESLKMQAIESAMQELEVRVRGAAASIAGQTHCRVHDDG